MAGRKPNATPNKVMVPNASKTVSNEDGSRTLSVPFNDENGTRRVGEITLAVENGRIVQRVTALV